MLQLGQGLRVVLDAEVEDALALAAEVGDQRVVGVQDEARAGRPARPPARPSGRPAARARRSGRAGRGTGWTGVEARLDRLGHRGQPGLVDLEQAELAAARGARRAARWPRPSSCSSRRGCAPRCGRRARGGREHRRGRRLAVGGRDEHRAVVQLAGHAARARRGEAQQQPPGRGGAAAAAEAAAGGPQRAGRAGARARNITPATMTRRQRVLARAWWRAWRRSGRRRRRCRRGGRSATSISSPRRTRCAAVEWVPLKTFGRSRRKASFDACSEIMTSSWPSSSSAWGSTYMPPP